MKNIIIAALLVLVVFIAGCQAGTTQVESTANNAKVSITNFAFEPSTITVAKGSTVTWENYDKVQHIVVLTGLNTESASLSKGDKFQYQFDKAGTYEYFCSVHPSMKGTVVVE